MNSSPWNPNGHCYQTFLFGYNHTKLCQKDEKKLTRFAKGLNISRPQRNKVGVPEYSWIAADVSTLNLNLNPRYLCPTEQRQVAGNVKWRQWNCISCCQRWEQIACRLNLQLYPVNSLNLWKGLCENQIKAQVSACLWMTNLDLLVASTVSTTPLKHSSSGVPWTSSPPPPF